MNNEQMMGYFPADYRFNLSDFALFLAVIKHKRAYECVLSILIWKCKTTAKMMICPSVPASIRECWIPPFSNPANAPNTGSSRPQ